MRTTYAAAFFLLALSSCAATPSNGSETQLGEPQLLARSTPADGSTVAGPVNNLQLKFARPVRLIEVTLNGPDSLSPMMITAAAETTDYEVPLPGITGGKYRVNWRASAAGRSYDGVLNFTVRD